MRARTQAWPRRLPLARLKQLAVHAELERPRALHKGLKVGEPLSFSFGSQQRCIARQRRRLSPCERRWRDASAGSIVR
jgi:hypothetical protein